MAVKLEGTQDAQHIMTGISHMIAFMICFILLLWLYFQIRVKEEKIGNTKLLIYTVLGIGLNGLTSLSRWYQIQADIR